MRSDDRTGLSAAWENNARQWLAWARTPAHDVYFWELNLPAFAQLVPTAGRRTLDVGCGEGRIGRWLTDHGHVVFGIDSSPTLAAHAASAGGYQQVVQGDARSLPWPENHFELAIAFMTLHDMSDHATAIREIARVLDPGGILCLAIVHPLNRPPDGLNAYFEETRFADTIARRGLTMTFAAVDRPLEAYTQALSAHGFVIEQLREPRASPAVAARMPELAPAASKPYFLHMRCRLAG